jgi:hypothetical protein
LTGTDPQDTDTDTQLLRLFIGDHLAGATWVDSHRGPRAPALVPDALPGNPADPRLCLRLFIGGCLADETWLDCSDPDAQRLADITTAVHSEGVDAAREYGVPWLIEVYDPASPEDLAYLRTGSDHAAMVAPVALALASSGVN